MHDSGCQVGWRNPAKFCRPKQGSPDGAPVSGPKFFQLDFSETDDHNSADEKPSQMQEVRPHGHPPQMQECLQQDANFAEQKVDPSSERCWTYQRPGRRWSPSWKTPLFHSRVKKPAS